MKQDNQFSFNKILMLIFTGILIYLFISNSGMRHETINVFKPVLVAFALAYLLDNIVTWYERTLRLKRGQSVLITCLILLLVGIYATAIGIPSLINSTRSLVNNFSKGNINFYFLEKFFINLDNDYIVAINQFFRESLEEILMKVGQSTGSILKELLSWTSSIFNTIISLVIAIYMLLDKHDLLARLKRLVYAYATKEQGDEVVRISRKANEIFSGFLIGKIIDSAIIGFLTFGILAVLQVPYYSLIGLIIGVTNMIPYFGPFIGAIPAILITLIHSPAQALWVAIVIILIQQFDGLILGPLILGDKVGVGPFWIITAVTLGGSIYGVVGMFLGVPVLVLGKTLLEELVDIRLKDKHMEDLEIDKLTPVKSKKKKITKSKFKNK